MADLQTGKRIHPQWRVAASGIGALAIIAVIAAEHGWRMPVLVGLAGLLGLLLYHAAFGFTTAYRRLFVARETTAVRAQLIMIAIATLLFAPTLTEGRGFAIAAAGANAPLGTQVLVGAFMFGLGMQLGNGCGSGTLFTLGGGSTRMVATIVFFCVGSFWGSLDMQWWNNTPRIDAIVLGEELGWSAALLIQLAVLAALWICLRHWGRDKCSFRKGFAWQRLLHGNWPLLWGGGRSHWRCSPGSHC